VELLPIDKTELIIFLSSFLVRMPYRVDIYIGGDNDSKKICESYLKKIRDWANAAFPDGYTLVKGEGIYNGISKESVLINALSNYNLALRRKLEKLK
jgi:hypothetical protein